MENIIETSRINDNLIAKLRRLKIQEEFLQKAVSKSTLKHDVADDRREFHEKYISNNLETKKFFDKLKSCFNEIKNLYEDIKLTSSLECDSIDIQQIKRDILDLESKIKSFKEFIRNQLEALCTEDLSMKGKVKQTKQSEIKVIRTSSNKKIALCSPVKVMMKSPFKYSEVQRFQDFMKNSPNQYGGWNEYNHNIFVKLWNKTYGRDATGDDETVCSAFRDEVTRKVAGVSAPDVAAHVQWYLQFLQHRNCQQIALEKWKENRSKMRKSARTDKAQNRLEPSPSNNPNSSCHKNSGEAPRLTAHSELCSRRPNKEQATPTEINLRVMKPTKQWINKCEKTDEKTLFCSDVERLGRLHIPNWRMSLINL